MIEFRHRPPARVGFDSTLQSYDQIYRERPILLQECYYQWALDVAAPRPGQRLLDVSCGVGRLVDYARKAGVRAIGVDFSPEAIGRATENRGATPFVVGDAQELPFQAASFDRVVNLGSLEHYERPDLGAAEMARVLRPDGQAVILVPNTFGFLHVFYAWRYGRVFDDGQPLQRYGTQADWHDLLSRNGLRVERVERFQRARPRSSSEWLWHVLRPTKLLQVLLDRFIPVNAASSLVFICRRSSTTPDDSPPKVLDEKTTLNQRSPIDDNNHV